MLNSDEVTNRIIPGLVTLSGDPDVLVRLKSVGAFGNVASTTDDARVFPICIPIEDIYSGFG